MTIETLRIIVNGATGGIVNRQHLPNALMPIIHEGGLRIRGKTIVPELLLVSRDKAKLAGVAARYGVDRWTTDLDAALSDPSYTVLFDAGHTGNRERVTRAALAAGKHVYTEKPVVTDLSVGHALLKAAKEAGVKFGVVEDKLFMPGMTKLRHLAGSGFFGKVTNFQLSFGFWFFSGHDYPDQRSSWNYKAAEGGGLVQDTYPHWRYVIEGILGPIRSLVARSWTAVPDRLDDAGVPYVADADDSNVTILELESGAIGTVSASTATRVRGDDLITFRIDGTGGSAIGGLHRCHIQPAAATPKVAYDPTVDLGIDYREHWQRLPEVMPFTNGFRMGWEGFIRHVAADMPPIADLAAGLRDVALAKAVLASSEQRRWVSMVDFVPGD